MQVPSKPQIPTQAHTHTGVAPNVIYSAWDLINLVNYDVMTTSEARTYFYQNKLHASISELVNLRENNILSISDVKATSIGQISVNSPDFQWIPSLLRNGIMSYAEIRKNLTKPSVVKELKTCNISTIGPLHKAGLLTREEAREYLKLGAVPYEGPADFNL
jgi:hypothetical protein